jgi:signal transduction histidine kinase
LQSAIAERELAEEGFIRARAEIARIARITTKGELAASIAHELNQPLGSMVMNGGACLRWRPQNRLSWTRCCRPLTDRLDARALALTQGILAPVGWWRPATWKQFKTQLPGWMGSQLENWQEEALARIAHKSLRICERCRQQSWG